MTRDRILLIDDEMDAVHVLRFALERAAFQVTCVVASDDALPAAIASEPHLVLLALEIGARDRRKNDGHSGIAPEGGRRFTNEAHHGGEAARWGEGARLCRSLRENPQTKEVPIVLMTGHSRADSQTIEAFKAGADDLIAKPFRPADVVARARLLIDENRKSADESLFGFPGARFLENHLRQILESGATWGAIHADLLEFSSFNAQHGAAKSDEVLHILARVLSEARSRIAPDAFLAHAGGDRFVLVTAPALLEPLARDIIMRYGLALRDIERRDYARRDSPAKNTSADDAIAPHRESAARVAKSVARDAIFEVVSPVVSTSPAHEYSGEGSWPRLALSGVTNEARRFRNPLEIVSVALEIKKALRNRPGSNYLKDRRGGEYDPQRAPHQS